MDAQTQAVLLALLRQALIAAGAILVTKGIASDGQVQTIVGAIVGIVTTVWMIVAKRQAHVALVTAAATGVVAPATVLSPITTSKGVTP
jgi:hypothetical protein